MGTAWNGGESLSDDENRPSRSGELNVKRLRQLDTLLMEAHIFTLMGTKKGTLTSLHLGGKALHCLNWF